MLRAFFRGLRKWMAEVTLKGLEPKETEISRTIQAIRNDYESAVIGLDPKEAERLHNELAAELRVRYGLWVGEVQMLQMQTWRTLELRQTEERRKLDEFFRTTTAQPASS